MPEGLKNGSGEDGAPLSSASEKYSEAAQLSGCKETDETETKLSKIDMTIRYELGTTHISESRY